MASKQAFRADNQGSFVSTSQMYVKEETDEDKAREIRSPDPGLAVAMGWHPESVHHRSRPDLHYRELLSIKVSGTVVHP